MVIEVGTYGLLIHRSRVELRVYRILVVRGGFTPNPGVVLGTAPVCEVDSLTHVQAAGL